MIQVVCAIIERKGRFLGCRRNAGKTQGGLWEFPGGKVHGDETAEAALAREIREELGVEIDVGLALGRSVHKYDHGTIELIAYRCSILSGDLIAAEHEEIKWLDGKEAMTLPWAPADIPLLEIYLARYAP